MTMVATILSVLSPIFYVLGYLPGLRTMYKEKTTEGIGRYFWELVTLTISYSYYTLLITNADLFNITVVAINLVFAVILLTYKNIIKYSLLKGIVYTLLYFVVNLSIYFLLGIPISVLQTIATISIILAYVDQILHFIIYKTAKGTNRNLYLIIGIGILLLTLSLIINGAYLHVIITEVVNLVLILICYVLAILYSKRDKVVEYEERIRKIRI